MQTVLVVIEQVLDHHDTGFILLKIEARDNLQFPPLDIDGQNIDVIDMRRACRQDCVKAPQVHFYFF